MMAVLIEAISVVLKASRVLDVLAWKDFCRMVPNKTMCADNELIRVGFMHPDDVRSFVDKLEGAGLVYFSEGLADDLCVVDQQLGPMAEASWLEVGHVEIDGHRVAAARLRGSEINQVVTPPGWIFEGSLSERFLFIANEATGSFRFEEGKQGVETTRSPLVDGPVFIGRTREE